MTKIWKRLFMKILQHDYYNFIWRKAQREKRKAQRKVQMFSSV